jgi:hypothetical protein
MAFNNTGGTIHKGKIMQKTALYSKKLVFYSVTLSVLVFTIIYFLNAPVGFILDFLAAFLAIRYAKSLLERGNIKIKRLKVLYWSNLVSWIIPFIGVYTSIASYTVNKENVAKDRSMYMLLAGIGLVLSTVNTVASFAGIQ